MSQSSPQKRRSQQLKKQSFEERLREDDEDGPAEDLSLIFCGKKNIQIQNTLENDNDDDLQIEDEDD